MAGVCFMPCVCMSEYVFVLLTQGNVVVTVYLFGAGSS